MINTQFNVSRRRFPRLCWYAGNHVISSVLVRSGVRGSGSGCACERGPSPGFDRGRWSGYGFGPGGLQVRQDRGCCAMWMPTM